MLKRTVPTVVKKLFCFGTAAFASIAKTSWSGSEKWTALSQFRPRRSSQWPLAGLNLTTSPVSGPVTFSTFAFGAGSPPGYWTPPTTHGAALAPPLQTTPSLTVAVWFPDSKIAAYTVPPSGLTASARGVSPKSVTTVSGVPPRPAPRLVASNTQTSARPIPGVVRSLSGTGLFWPRCAVVMNARVKKPLASRGPANTMSRGSSPTSSVAVTRGGLVPVGSSWTTLTLSERWLTTHTSVLVRAATATGSSPTGTLALWARSPVPGSTASTSRRLSGVSTAKRRVPSGERASGRTGPLSNVTNPAPAAVPAATARAKSPISALRQAVTIMPPSHSTIPFRRGRFFSLPGRRFPLPADRVECGLRMQPASSPALSVVVPAYDEAPNLERLLAEVRAALDPTGLSWELIVVDDGSGDDTPAVLARLAAAEPRLRPLRQPARSGQTAALVAGFRAARGALVATLDADLQCPPAELPALLAALGTADLACGIRAHRHDPVARRLASALSNLARRAIVAPRVRDLACPLRLFRAEALRRVEEMTPLFDGAHRWLPALFVLAGLRVVQRPVAHQPRRAGVSKYTTAGRAGPVARELLRVLALAIPRSRGLKAVIALAASALVLVPFVYHLGGWPLLEPDEGRNAEVAREMLARGTWGVPHFDYLPYLDKPVLLFWLIAAAFRVLGVNELAARLPSALTALATVALTFALARALLPGVRRAVLAAVVLATSPLVLAFARIAIFDMPLTALATGALLCLVLARLRGAPWPWWPLAGLAMGLGVLCKGPVGIAVPLVAFAAGRGALPAAPRRAGAGPALVATLVAAAVVVPWLVHVEWRQPGFLRYAVLDETLLRFTSVERFDRAGPGYYYLPVLLWAGGLWSLLLALVAPTLVRRARTGGAEGAAIRFAARAAAAIVLVFTLSASKRPQYVLPALVPLALLTAIGVDAAA